MHSVGLALFEGKDVATEEKNPQNNEKGFAGLSSMVSNVDATVASTPKQQQREASTQQSTQAARPERQEQSKPAHQTYQAPAQPSGGSTAGKWLFGIAAIIFLIWLVSLSNNNRSSRSSYSPETSSMDVAPDAQPPAVQAPSLSADDLPSIGRNNVLSTAQIRYCLAEKIRLDAAESVINNAIDSDVSRFNEYVNDYNSRCGEFRYQRGALESAQSDVEPYRSQLQAEGIGRFVRSPSASTESQIPAQTQQSVRPSPNPTIQPVQRRLSDTAGVHRSNLSELSSAETDSIEAACSTEKYLEGPAAYNKCLTKQLASLSKQSRRPDLSQLSNSELDSIEAACSTEKYLEGPAAYNKCLARHLSRLRN